MILNAESMSVGDSDPLLRKLTTKQENLVADLTRLFIHLSSDGDANACRRMPERKSVFFRRRAVGRRPRYLTSRTEFDSEFWLLTFDS